MLFWRKVSGDRKPEICCLYRINLIFQKKSRINVLTFCDNTITPFSIFLRKFYDIFEMWLQWKSADFMTVTFYI